MADPTQLFSFGTSGYRGSPLHGAFTEAHILAITQAICDYRRSQGTDGPLYMGKDMQVLMTMLQRAAGLKNCRRTSGSTCGSTCSAPLARASRPPGS
jgi:phosphoglucomutase